MIPVRANVPARGAPLLVVSLIGANLGVYLYEVSLAIDGGAGAVTHFVETWGLVPREIVASFTAPRTAGPSDWLTPLTAMFLHGGPLHLLGNLLYLWIFGRSVEDLLGHARFALFYLVCGLAAAATEVARNPSGFAPMLGASGAVSGVLGAYFVSYPGGRLRLLWPRLRVPAAGFLLLWVVIQVASGVSGWGEDQGRVAWWAHVGGFVAGVALVPAMRVRKPTRTRLRI